MREKVESMRSKCRVRKGDEVVVLAGRSKGQTGKIESIAADATRVFVAGVNLYKKHQKPTQQDPNGGIVEKPMSIHISNVALVDPKTKKATRVGIKIDQGKKFRVAKASQTVL